MQIRNDLLETHNIHIKHSCCAHNATNKTSGDKTNSLPTMLRGQRRMDSYVEVDYDFGKRDEDDRFLHVDGWQRSFEWLASTLHHLSNKEDALLRSCPLSSFQLPR